MIGLKTSHNAEKMPIHSAHYYGWDTEIRGEKYEQIIERRRGHDTEF
jgi:hypothetical protein